MMNPAGGNVVARSKAEGPKCSGMVNTFITQISTGTVHVLQGDPKCVERISWTVDMQVPAAHEYEPGSCPSKHQQHAENNKYTIARREPLDLVNKERITLQSLKSFKAVLLHCLGTQRRRDDLGGDDGTKKDIISSMR